jgi:hypothetical protein
MSERDQFIPGAESGAQLLGIKKIEKERPGHPDGPFL